ncbi:MAG: ABC transporter ATP-binding protein [bacterium]
MNEYLYVENLSKSYYHNNEKNMVLKNVNFKVKISEFVAILGPSGCGKTTLLKIIGGFLDSDNGSVNIGGKKISGSSPDRIMVFQEFRQLFPWKTILNNVVFAIKASSQIKSSAEREKKAYSFLEKVGLAEYSAYYPHQLSGGMKQRVALARALAADPEILLMDEPFGSLDSQTRTNLQKLLIDIWMEARKTILFVTHDIEEALLLADKIIIMKDNPGRIIKNIDNKLKRPRDRTSIEFINLYKDIVNNSI